MSNNEQTLVSESDSCFKLPSVLDINYAPTFYENLKEFLNLDSEICLEASEVSRLTTPCIQILLSFFETLKSRGANVKVLNPSESFCKSITDLGLGQHEITTKFIKG